MIRKRAIACLLFAGAVLPAQGLWDSSFKLVAGRASLNPADYAGRTTQLGLSIEGSHPLPGEWGSVVVEGGYRKFMNAEVKDPAIPSPLPVPASGTSTFAGTDQESNSQGWLGSVLWRHAFGPEGFYGQAGLRMTSYTSRASWTSRVVSIDNLGNVTEVKSQTNASSSQQGWGPVAGVGFRFDRKVSLDLQISQQAVPIATGGTRKVSVLELALGIHP
jgi:hypothetical protein